MPSAIAKIVLTISNDILIFSKKIPDHFVLWPCKENMIAYTQVIAIKGIIIFNLPVSAPNTRTEDKVIIRGSTKYVMKAIISLFVLKYNL